MDKKGGAVKGPGMEMKCGPLRLVGARALCALCALRAGMRWLEHREDRNTRGTKDTV